MGQEREREGAGAGEIERKRKAKGNRRRRLIYYFNQINLPWAGPQHFCLPRCMTHTPTNSNNQRKPSLQNEHAHLEYANVKQM